MTHRVGGLACLSLHGFHYMWSLHAWLSHSLHACTQQHKAWPGLYTAGAIRAWCNGHMFDRARQLAGANPILTAYIEEQYNVYLLQVSSSATACLAAL